MKSQRIQTTERRSVHHKHNSLHLGNSRSRYVDSKFLTVQFFRLLLVFVCLSPLTASAQMQSLGDLSFVVPAGWIYSQQPGFNVATVSRSDGRDYCIMLITEPFQSTHNASTDFAITWKEIVTSGLHDPLPGGRLLEHNSSSGYSGKLNGGTSPGRGQSRWVSLFLLEAGIKVIPVVVVASSNEIYLHLNDPVVKFLDSIRLSSSASFVGNNHVEPQVEVGQAGMQAYYQRQALEEQKRLESHGEQWHEDQLHQEILQ